MEKNTLSDKQGQAPPGIEDNPMSGVRLIREHPLNRSQLPQEPRVREMNKTEARYAQLLEGMRLAREIVSYQYEAIKLVLGYDPKTGRLVTFLPDFLVIRTIERPAGNPMECKVEIFPILELHEVKGPHEWEDAKLKRIWASQQFPHFVFKLCRWQKGTWDIRIIV